jgi:hypothetical protein
MSQFIHDYLQGFAVALGSGTVVVCWRWLAPLRAEMLRRHKLRQDDRSYRGYDIQGD